MQGSFNRFTERARWVLRLAQEEAERFNHDSIGTEHILLGLIREGQGVAAKVLTNLGVEPVRVRLSVERILPRGEREVKGDIGLTPRAKKTIELAVDEARRLGHHYIGTEHLLLGLLREGEGVAAGVLENLGIDVYKARSQVMQILTRTTWHPPHGVTRQERRVSYPWRYLTIPTSARDGVRRAEPFDAPPRLPNVRAGMRIEQVLDVLGRAGWELMGIITPQAEPGHALYVFRRPA